MNPKAVLCYVDDDMAWFTTCPLDKQWGDDWNDAPYDCNAGDPYAWKPYMAEREDPLPEYELFSVVVYGPYAPPQELHVSVESINQGNVPWLRCNYGNYIPIYAGTTFEKFVELIERVGGTIYTDYQQVKELERQNAGYRQYIQAYQKETDRLNANGKILATWIHERGRGVDDVMLGIIEESGALETALEKLITAAIRLADMQILRGMETWGCRYCKGEFGNHEDDECPVWAVEDAIKTARKLLDE